MRRKIHLIRNITKKIQRSLKHYIQVLILFIRLIQINILMFSKNIEKRMILNLPMIRLRHLL